MAKSLPGLHNVVLLNLLSKHVHDDLTNIVQEPGGTPIHEKYFSYKICMNFRITCDAKVQTFDLQVSSGIGGLM